MDSEGGESILNAITLPSDSSCNCALDFGRGIDLNAISILACFLNKNDRFRGDGTFETIGGGEDCADDCDAIARRGNAAGGSRGSQNTASAE